MKWRESHTRELLRLHKYDKYFWKEIAEQLGLKENVVRHYARKLGLKHGPHVKARYGSWNIKHKQLREPVFKYFVNHSWNETKEVFGLTDNELKSIFTIGYRDPKFKNLRKDSRRHDSWSEKELIFLIKHAGIKPRDWIARKLNRGSMQSTKECLERLKTGSKYINGLPERLANLIVQVEGIKTSAGAPGPKRNCHIKIVPWVGLESAIQNRKIKPEIRAGIKALARFQRWIFGVHSNAEVLTRIKRISNEK